ncbi:MAG: hypothetical protein LC650_02965 [Actinobacteria bacterium]|nr:hypothetical protein [Actinomycetota bacterium]
MAEQLVNVRFMAFNDEAKVAGGIVMNCPSVEALRTKLEGMGALVIFAEEASAEEVAEAQREQEEG